MMRGRNGAVQKNGGSSGTAAASPPAAALLPNTSALRAPSQHGPRLKNEQDKEQHLMKFGWWKNLTNAHPSDVELAPRSNGVSTCLLKEVFRVDVGTSAANRVEPRCQLVSNVGSRGWTSGISLVTSEENALSNWSSSNKVGYICRTCCSMSLTIFLATIRGTGVLHV